MNFDYRFPLFDELLEGKLNPLRPENDTDRDYHVRLEEQVLSNSVDKGRFMLRFPQPTHPKMQYYQRLLTGETYAYCNDLLDYLNAESNMNIRAYLRDKILDKHLITCLKRLGEVIRIQKLNFSSLSQPSSTDNSESLANCYVFHLLKACISKTYLEVQLALADVVVISQSELMLYTAYMGELPPLKTFLSKRKEAYVENPVVLEKQKTDETGDKSKAMDRLTSTAEYYTVKEVAEKLRLDDRTVRRRMQSGELKGIKDKRGWLIDKTELEVYMAKLNQQTKAHLKTK